MWAVWTKANKFHKSPSEVIDPSYRLDDLTRYQVDNAVTHFGLTLENALNERVEVKVGKRTESRPKYTLPELLDDKFRLPRPQTDLQKRQQGAMNLLAMAQDPASGVKLWRELPPEERQE